MNKQELIERLRDLDEVLLVELLGVNSTDIVDAFLDKIEDNIDYLRKEIQDEEG